MQLNSTNSPNYAKLKNVRKSLSLIQNSTPVGQTPAGRILNGDVRVLWVPPATRNAVLKIHVKNPSEKLIVASIRHRLTEYDLALAELGRLPRKCPVYCDIRNSVLDAIGKAYPEYAKAAKLQKLGTEPGVQAMPKENPLVSHLISFLDFNADELDRLLKKLSSIQRTLLLLLVEGKPLDLIGGLTQLKQNKVQGFFDQIRNISRSITAQRRLAEG